MPFTCEACGQQFCQDHFRREAHDCSASEAVPPKAEEATPPIERHDHPSVSVETVVDIALRHAQSEMAPTDFLNAHSTLLKVFNNILFEPGNDKYRTLKKGNAVVQAKLCHPACIKVLRLGGFSDVGEAYVCRPAADLSVMRRMSAALRAASLQMSQQGPALAGRVASVSTGSAGSRRFVNSVMIDAPRSSLDKRPSVATRGAAEQLCVPMDEWRCARDWFEALFGFREESYADTRQRLKAMPDRDGFWSLQGENGVKYKAGRFTTPSLSELELEAARLGGMGALSGRVTVRNVKGDVATFHSQIENRHATFQVASQFNCLEFPAPWVTPENGITKYVSDRTQGPACSVACGPATALRNYFVEVGGVSGQTCDRQVQNLQGMLAQLGPAGKHITVRNGYTFAADNGLMVVKGVLQDSTSLQKSCQQELRIGVHEDVQVTASKWGLCQQHDSDHTVTQVFGSACSVACSEGRTGLWASFARLVLLASFEATLWAGLLSALRHGGRSGSRRVFLTCLGGGVFGNPMSWISEAMQAALEKFARVNLEVFIVTYTGPIPDALEDLERRFGNGP